MNSCNVASLLNINNAVMSVYDREAFTKKVVEILKQLMICNAAYLFAFDHEQKGMHVFAENLLPLSPDNGTVNGDTVVFKEKLNRSIKVMTDMPALNRTQVISREILMQYFPDFSALEVTQNSASRFLSVPMKVQKDIKGFLILVSDQTQEFSKLNFQFLEDIATQLAIGVNNVLEYELLQQREREKALQLAVGSALVSIKERDKLHLAIASEINKVVPADFFGIRIISSTGILEDFTNLLKTPGSGFTSITAAMKEHAPDLEKMTSEAYGAWANTMICSGPQLDEMVKKFKLTRFMYERYGIRSAMYVPLQIMQEKSAAMILSSKIPYAFSEHDLSTVKQLVPQISLAFENLIAFEKIDKLRQQLEQEKTYLQDEIKTSYNFEEIIGKSTALEHVLTKVKQVAPTDATVLVEGETGTGKELIARAIHHLSPRNGRALVKVNCATLPAQLIESELFGHERGSFTGAVERRIGKFELANGGTIFLDEIGELPLELQPKLLRVLQEKEFERIGGKETIKLNVRVIAATNRNLQKEIATGKFRSDLYYRLNVFPVTIPPLRDRREDIPVLARYLVQKISKKVGKRISSIQDKSLVELIAYDWPGNIRELEHLLERAVILSNQKSLSVAGLLNAREEPEKPVGFKSLEEMERDYILSVLRKTGGRVSGTGGAAEILNIKRTTLEARMKKLRIHKSFVAA